MRSSEVIHGCLVFSRLFYCRRRIKVILFFFSSRRRHTRCGRDWSSDVCSSDLAVYKAYNQARAEVRSSGTLPVPMHLRNAPTKLMKQIGYGKNYQYDHDAEGGIALDQTGFPDELGEQQYYHPVERGLEIKLKEKLDALRIAREQARAQKKPE